MCAYSQGKFAWVVYQNFKKDRLFGSILELTDSVPLKYISESWVDV